MCTFEVHLCMMSGQLILSGKPFNTFSMARLKYCNCVWPSLPFPIPPRILLYKSIYFFWSRISEKKKNPNHDSRKLKFAIFENFTNKRHKWRVTRIKKKLMLSGKPFNTFSMARLKYCNCVWSSLPFPIPPRILLYKLCLLLIIRDINEGSRE
jgi:hypothetical protein